MLFSYYNTSLFRGQREGFLIENFKGELLFLLLRGLLLAAQPLTFFSFSVSQFDLPK